MSAAALHDLAKWTLWVHIWMGFNFFAFLQAIVKKNWFFHIQKSMHILMYDMSGIFTMSKNY